MVSKVSYLEHIPCLTSHNSIRASNNIWSIFDDICIAWISCTGTSSRISILYYSSCGLATHIIAFQSVFISCMFLRNRLKQHLKICTKARDRSVVEKQPFYTPGINLPSLVSKDAPVATPVSAADNEVVQSWMERISIAWPKAVKQVMGDVRGPLGGVDGGGHW